MKKFNILILFQIVLFIGLQSQNSLLDQNFEELRPISEINEANKGDGYPWLSEDGLRLYYNANDPLDNRTKIYMSSRKSDGHAFTNPIKLNVNIDGYDNLSPVLSEDELTLSYVVKRNNGRLKTKLFIATREHKTNAFNAPHSVKLIGQFAGTVISPGFSPDYRELYLFNELNGETSILVFSKEDYLEYHLKEQMEIPRGYKVKSGKISADGLKYYISLSPKGGYPRIYIMKRDDTGSPFGTPILLESQWINDPDIRNHQPYFTNNHSYLVFTRSRENAWYSNDMFVAKLVDTPAEQKAEEDTFTLAEFQLYPNPLHDILNIRASSESTYHIRIFDLTGKMIMRYQEASGLTQLSLGKQAAGIYIVVLEEAKTGKTLSLPIEKIRL